MNHRVVGCVAWAMMLGAFLAQPLDAQTRTVVAGRVVDARTGAPLPGVEVSAEGRLGSVVTDTDGRFSLEIAADPPIALRFSLVGHRDLEVDVTPGQDPEEVALEAMVFELDPLEVEVNPSEIDRRRASGSSSRYISRLEIVQSLGYSMDLGDVLRRHVPSLRVRETNLPLMNPLGREVCLEFRGAAARSAGAECRAPLIVVDGVRVGHETTVLQSLPLDDVAEVEVLPPGEAGVLYGPEAADGVIKITTLRGAMGSGGGGFNWRLDPAGHPTWRVAAGTTLGYAVGLAAGVAVGRRCLNETFNHQIESSCETGGTIGSVVAMVLAPSIGAAFGARIAGTTERSRGRFVPSLVGGAATVAPAYLFLALGGGEVGMEAFGIALLAAGVPATVTIVDKLFRRLR